MPLLEATDYPAVRAALSTALTPDMLPDTVIGLGIYAEAAEADVLALDAAALTRTGDELARVKRAAILFCAARLAPAVPQLLSSRVHLLSTTFAAVDWQALATTLREQARAEVTAVTQTQARPTLFTLGRSGV